MICFPITINGKEVLSTDVFKLCADHSAKGMQSAINFIVEKTNCTREEAKEAVADLLHMDSVRNNPPAVKFNSLIPNDPNENEKSYIPKCPVCGSPDIKKISGLTRAVSFEAFGFASSTARAQRQCKNCGYKF